VAMGNVAPDAGLHVTGSVPSTMSVADALKVTTAPLALVASTVIFAGTVIDGGVLVPADATTGVSVRVTVSFTEMDTVVSGGGGGVLVPAPLTVRVCVKFDSDAVLVRLLRSALPVNVMGPVAVPEVGAKYEMEKMQAPAGGSVVGKVDAPLVQEIREILKGDPGAVTAERERFACPMLETDNGSVPVCPPKSRLPVEKYATGTGLGTRAGIGTTRRTRLRVRNADDVHHYRRQLQREVHGKIFFPPKITGTAQQVLLSLLLTPLTSARPPWSESLIATQKAGIEQGWAGRHNNCGKRMESIPLDQEAEGRFSPAGSIRTSDILQDPGLSFDVGVQYAGPARLLAAGASELYERYKDNSIPVCRLCADHACPIAQSATLRGQVADESAPSYRELKSY
jgi:hypothetical protein